MFGRRAGLFSALAAVMLLLGGCALDSLFEFDRAEGILQDMHWAGDYIGYFQSYALGNIYDGQIRKALLSEIPDLYEQIRHGEFDRLNKWMKEHIWQYGCCYTSGEMLKRLTGKTLDAVPFLDYMKEKYADLYGIHI